MYNLIMEKIIITDIVNGMYNSSNLPNKYSKPEYNIFTNIYLKHMNMVNRMIYLNEKIEEEYNIWLKLLSEPKIDMSSPYAILKSSEEHNAWQRKITDSVFYQEEIIMHLRRVIDDSIVLISIVKNIFTKDKKKKLLRPFESIGECLSEFDKFKFLEQHKDFLKLVNELSNSFKHCTVNTMENKIGQNEPCIYVYTKGDSNFYNEIGISINGLIRDFNNYYSTFHQILTTG